MTKITSMTKMTKYFTTFALAALLLICGSANANASPHPATTHHEVALTPCEIYVFTFTEILNKLNMYTTMYLGFVPREAAVALAWATIRSEMAAACSVPNP